MGRSKKRLSDARKMCHLDVLRPPFLPIPNNQYVFAKGGKALSQSTILIIDRQYISLRLSTGFRQPNDSNVIFVPRVAEAVWEDDTSGL